MSRSDPPPLAIALMTRLVSGPHRESLIGDLIEQHQRGRSTLWFWRQTLIAIVRSGGNEMRCHPVMTLWISVFSASFEQIYMRSGIGGWFYRIDRLWYPRLLDSRWSWMVVNPWAYRLQLFYLTGRVVWCGLLALLSWTISRMYPRQRGLAVTLLLVPQIAMALYYIRPAMMDWLREPADPIAFFGLFWFAVFALVAVPSGILLAGLGGQRVTETP
jgi:hypothetical protein